MFGPCVIVFNSSSIPLRHIITLQSTYDAGEFKQWYYTNYAELEDDQFVYCETREERDTLLAKLENARAYRLVASLWAEKETDDEVIDVPAQLFRDAGKTIQSAFALYTESHPMDAGAVHNDHVFWVSPMVATGENGQPKLRITVWLDQDDISEREWNRLLDAMSDCLLNGWGRNFTEQHPCDSKESRLWIHFGDVNSEKINFTVQEI